MTFPLRSLPFRRHHLIRFAAGTIAFVYLVLWLSAIAVAQEPTRADRSTRPRVTAVAAAASDPGVIALPVASTPASPAQSRGSAVDGEDPSAAPRLVAATDPAATSAAVVDAGTPSMGSEFRFLDCVRHRESRGQYRALNPSGAAGAYQLMPVTARQVAQRAGRPDLAATPVVDWSVADQDLMALVLLRWQGPAPWGGACW